MWRKLSGVLLTVAVIACSGKAPSAGESSGGTTTTRDVPSVTPPPAKPLPPPDPRETALGQTVVKLFEREHLLRKKIDDEVSRMAFDEYLDRLDGLKMFLLESDRKALADKHIDKIDDELRAGSLELAHDGAKLFASRVELVAKIVDGVLAQPMNHTDEEWIETDPEKVKPVATEDELKERWRQRLELEVMERVAGMEARLEAKAKAQGSGSGSAAPSSGSGAGEDDERAMPIAEIPTTPEAREAKARADLAKSYSGRFARLRNPETLDAAADMINAVASVLDPHTAYLPPADKANFDIHMSGQLEGIGATLRERDHYIEVVELVPGGAAWRQGGLAPSDLILAVQQEGKDPVDVIDMRIDDVVKMIRGPKGTVVRLRIQKAGGHEETLAITRDKVVVEETYARGAVLTRKGQRPIGYIHLPSFYGAPGQGQRMASSDVRRLLNELKAQKVAGIILDIRSNGGGLLNDAVKLTGEFINKGPVVQVQDSRNQRETLSDDDRGTEYEGPMVVMVDRFSASASEIFAGALQDYHRAIIVGTANTHGKGTVQTIADLDRITGSDQELGVLKLTIQQFFRVSGSSTQREGVAPDIVLPDPFGHVDSGERELHHAIAWSSINGAPHDDWPLLVKTPTLVQKSATRVAKHPQLSKIASATSILRARKNDTRVPLAKPAWDARRKELRAQLEAASPDLSKAPPAFAVKVIEDPTSAANTAPNPGNRQDDRLAKWSAGLSTDPWVDETLSILADMGAK